MQDYITFIDVHKKENGNQNDKMKGAEEDYSLSNIKENYFNKKVAKPNINQQLVKIEKKNKNFGIGF